MRLIEYRRSIKAGDLLGNGQPCKPDQSVHQLIRYEYETSSTVPCVVERSMKIGSKPKSTVRNTLEQTNLTRPLSGTIEFPNHSILNGTPIASQDQPENEFQFYNGRVVPVTNSLAVDSAKNARFRQSLIGSPIYYVGLTILILVSGGIIWKKNR